MPSTHWSPDLRSAVRHKLIEAHLLGYLPKLTQSISTRMLVDIVRADWELPLSFKAPLAKDILKLAPKLSLNHPHLGDLVRRGEEFQQFGRTSRRWEWGPEGPRAQPHRPSQPILFEDQA